MTLGLRRASDENSTRKYEGLESSWVQADTTCTAIVRALRDGNGSTEEARNNNKTKKASSITREEHGHSSGVKFRQFQGVKNGEHGEVQETQRRVAVPPVIFARSRGVASAVYGLTISLLLRPINYVLSSLSM